MQKKSALQLVALTVGIAMLVILLPINTWAYNTSSRLPFGVYSNVPNDSSILPTLQKYYTSSTDVLFPDFNMRSFEFKTFPNQQKLILSDSLPAIQAAIPYAVQNHVDYIAYDYEKWSFTPLSEQNDAVSSFNSAAQIIHAAGLKFAYNPTMTGFKTNYMQLDWKKCDMVILPFDGIAKWPKYTTLTITVANYIKSVNPNIIIYDTVNLNYATPEQIITAVQGVRNYVDGELVRYVLPCTYCSTTNLDQILAEITKQ